MKNFEIIGKYVFGCGIDDPTQYSSSHDEDYICRQDNGAFALNVAKQYGAKPITQIKIDAGIIDVYMLLQQYAAELHTTDVLPSMLFTHGLTPSTRRQ